MEFFNLLFSNLKGYVFFFINGHAEDMKSGYI